MSTIYLYDLCNTNIKCIDMVVVNLYPFEKMMNDNKLSRILKSIDLFNHFLIYS